MPRRPRPFPGRPASPLLRPLLSTADMRRNSSMVEGVGSPSLVRRCTQRWMASVWSKFLKNALILVTSCSSAGQGREWRRRGGGGRGGGEAHVRNGSGAGQATAGTHNSSVRGQAKLLAAADHGGVADLRGQQLGSDGCVHHDLLELLLLVLGPEHLRPALHARLLLDLPHHLHKVAERKDLDAKHVVDLRLEDLLCGRRAWREDGGQDRGPRRASFGRPRMARARRRIK